jgi:8-oxo-dGTP pyrophosphatase MutT (NUDIX family)
MARVYSCKKGCCTIQELARVIAYSKKRRGNCPKAGVFIYDPEEKRVLLVQSRGQLWGVPKGTLEVDKFENVTECAVREVKEETGITIDSSQFLYSVRIKNRAVYFYAELAYFPVSIQESIESIESTGNTDENDANGITWIKLDCLNDFIDEGNIILSHHCRVLFLKILGISFPKSNFIKVERRRKNSIKRK